MNVINTTCYSNEEVKRLVRFGLGETETAGLLVRVTHTRVSRSRKAAGGKYLYGASGLAISGTQGKPDTPPGTIYEILLRVAKPDEFPAPWYVRRGHPPIDGDLVDWREALVTIAGHEGQHITFYREGKRGRSKHEVEASCDAHAAGRLRRYRESLGQRGTGAVEGAAAAGGAVGR